MKGYRTEGIKPNYGALVLALPFSALSFLLALPQKKNADAGKLFEGTQAACITLLDHTPVELKSLCLTFNVSCYGTCAYGVDAPSVHAEYTLYNPEETEQTVRLAFPYELVKFRSDADEWNNRKNCIIKTGEDDIDYTLRYTYRKASGFDAYTCVRDLANDDIGFYESDLAVTKYVYRVEAGGGNGDEAVKVFLKGSSSAKVMRDSGGDGAFVENLYRCLSVRLSGETNEVIYYALGGKIEIDHIKSTATNGVVPFSLVSETQTTFKSFIEEARPEDIGADDWYDIVVDYLNDTETEGMLPPVRDCLAASFVRWYVYEVTVPAQATLVHTVQSPFYPCSSPNANCFLYQLSPLKDFPAFGEISVEINTPYYIRSNVEMTRTEEGYAFTRGDLPYGELSFIFDENDFTHPFRPENTRQNVLTLSLCILAVLVAGTIVLVVSLVVSNKKVRQNREALQKRADMGRPEEGKIDEDRK